MIQTHTFSESLPENLSRELNTFIADLDDDVEVIDIKFSTSHTECNEELEYTYSALIIFRE